MCKVLRLGCRRSFKNVIQCNFILGFVSYGLKYLDENSYPPAALHVQTNVYLKKSCISTCVCLQFYSVAVCGIAAKNCPVTPTRVPH